MSSRTIWIMLLLVAALGGLVLWQLGREQGGEFAVDRALCEGLRPERVQRLRLDNLERSLQLNLQRDENGAWQITDPLDYQADPGVLDRLLELLASNRATLVDRPDLAALSLSPPRAVLEILERLPAGERSLRLELGAVDIDRKHVFARIDGVVVRTSMNLDSTLERDLADWRDRRILKVDPASVVSVGRSGALVLEAGAPALELGLDAASTDTGWRASRPWNAALDPGAIIGLVTNLCYLRARSFLGDSAAQLPLFGLEQPDLRLELGLQDGSEQTLLLRREPESEAWICSLAGSVHVYRVDDIDVVFLSMPSDGFLDLRLLRIERDRIQRIELENPEGRFALRREGALWTLESKAGSVRADSIAVSDLMGAIESARAARFLVDEDALPFDAGERPASLRVFAAEGLSLGLEFGAPHAAGPGLEGRLFRRIGDELVGVVDLQAAAFGALGFEQLSDRQMIRLPEQGIARIELSRGPFRRAFVRDAASGRWSVEGTPAEAPKPFLKCIERLLSLRADVAIALDAPFELSNAWSVLIVDGGGVRISYQLGILGGAAGERWGFDDGKLRGDVSSSGLYADLEQIP